MTQESKLTLASFLVSKRVKGLIEKGKRIDGRALNEFRELTIEPNVISIADGSAKVTLGSTVIVAGINFGLDHPFPDTPNMGMLFTEGEILPTASLRARPGPPSERAIELSRVVDRGVRESKMLPMEEMVLEPGERVLKVNVDFSILADSGNLIDAASLAAVAALSTSTWPDPDELRKKTGIAVEEVSRTKLPLRDLPVAVTVADLFGQLVSDPSSEEELVLNSRLTVTHTKDDVICAMQKGGRQGLTTDQIHEAVGMAEEKSKELRQFLIDAVGGVTLAKKEKS
ncbi:MAG: RNA-binding protein [Candidatus Geothermarchaeales archaeon]